MALCMEGEGITKESGRTINISRCVAFSEHGKYFRAGVSHSIHFKDREHACVVKAQYIT